MRLDVFLTENNYFNSRAKSVEAIKKGLVYVNDKLQDKPSKEVCDTDKVTVIGELKFVSKGGYKLDKALTQFNFDVSNMIFADIGASTGGFTDCLLKRNVKKVYAVDVGENQLDSSLLCDRVVVMDNTNARYLDKTSFSDRLEGIVVDCSFISLKLLLPTFDKLLDTSGQLFALIKPQFECGAKNLTKSGILKDPKIRLATVMDVICEANKYGSFAFNLCAAPKFNDKNIEYVVHFAKNSGQMDTEKIKSLILD